MKINLKSCILLPPAALLAWAIFHQGNREPAKEPSGAMPEPAARARVAAPAPRIDWPQIAGQGIATSPSGQIETDSEYGRLLKRLEAMSGSQLVAAWDELAEAKLHPDARARFEGLILGSLTREDPELALNRFTDRLADPSTGTLLLSPGYRDWAMKFPLKARLWLDARIKDGTLNEDATWMGTPARVLFERELIRNLLLSGTDQVEARLNAIPHPWRVSALQGTETAQTQRAYASLVRKYFPERDRMAEFGRMAAAARYHEGLDGVTNILDRIEASPEEREQILRQTAGGTDDP